LGNCDPGLPASFSPVPHDPLRGSSSLWSHCPPCFVLSQNPAPVWLFSVAFLACFTRNVALGYWTLAGFFCDFYDTCLFWLRSCARCLTSWPPRFWMSPWRCGLFFLSTVSSSYDLASPFFFFPSTSVAHFFFLLLFSFVLSPPVQSFLAQAAGRPRLIVLLCPPRLLVPPWVKQLDLLRSPLSTRNAMFFPLYRVG